MFVRVKNPDGVEALVTLEAFDVVWKHKGFTLIEDAPVDATDEPKPRKRKTTK